MQKKYILVLLLAAGAIVGLWQVLRSIGPDQRSGRLGTMDQSGSGGEFSRDMAGLPEARATETVTLKNGDVYEMEMSAVRKKIGDRWVRMLAYNGSVPGPVFSIPQGAEITVRLKNTTDIETTMHSHGVRMENAFDGVPDMTQQPIRPGETFEYRLRFLDAGAYWYHPHVRTDYALEAGLYGNYIVAPADTDYWAGANREVALILDDIALDKNGILPFRKDVADHTLMGRFGDVMLVNGETDYALQVKQGEVVRLYLTNAANTRAFNFTLPNVRMKLVGADVGRYERETFVNGILLGPGERRVVDVLFETPGTYTMTHETPGKKYELGTVTVASDKAASSFAEEFSGLRTNTEVTEEMQVLEPYFDAAPDKSLRLTLDMNSRLQGMMSSGGGNMGGGHMMDDGSMMSGAMMGQGDDGDAFEWEDTMPAMNRISDASMMTWKLVDTATGKANKDITGWKFKVGDKVKIRIFNDPQSAHPMQHPIHFHGQRFAVLATNGVKNENAVWKDTVLIPKGDTVDILLDVSNPGEWMAHCHILEHAESGMMFQFSASKN